LDRAITTDTKLPDPYGIFTKHPTQPQQEIFVPTELGPGIAIQVPPLENRDIRLVTDCPDKKLLPNFVTNKQERGLNSGRPFNPDAAGGLIRNLHTASIHITQRGVDFVEKHLARFGPDEANTYMINRLRAIASGEIEPTASDLNFYSHELREYVRYRNLGWPEGQPADPEAAMISGMMHIQQHSKIMDCVRDRVCSTIQT
jgi:hypothetical protein